MRRVLLATTALLSASLAPSAFAQQSEAEAVEEGTIIVTARQRDETLIDVPIPVSVATQEQLKRDQIYTLTDLQRITPALEVSQTAGAENNGGGRLRGLGTGVFNPSVSPSVALIVDQAAIGNLSFPQIFDIAQVEVLRGPQGTLFGQGASAGAVHIKTRNPSTDAPAGNFSINYADKGTAGSEVGELVATAGINVPLSGKVAFRLAGQYKREKGLQRSVTTGQDNVIRESGIRLKVLLEPSETVKINLSAEYGQQDANGPTFFAAAIAATRATPFGPPGATLASLSNGAYLNPAGCALTVISPRAEEFCESLPSRLKLDAKSVGAVIDWEASDALTLTSVTSYRDRSFKQFSRDFSRITGTFAARQERTQEDNSSFSQEVRANIKTDSFDVILGGYYYDYKFERLPIGTGAFGVNSNGNRIGFGVCNSGTSICAVSTTFTQEKTNNRTLAGFVDATAKLSDKFNIFGGLRLSDYKNNTFVQVFPAPAAGPASVPRTRDLSESNLSGRIGASYRPNNNLNIYGSFARGYKPSAVGTSAAGTLFELRPELSDAFEIGAKVKLGRIRVEGNIFHTAIKNFQNQRSVFVGTALVSEPFNVPGRVKSKGFELTAQGEIVPGLNINAGYQFNDVKFPKGVFGDDAVDTNGDGVFDNNVIAGLPFRLDGTQFLFAPKHKLTFSGEYATEVSDGLEVFLNANIIYKSKLLLANRADPRYRYPAHEIINLGFGFRDPDGRWTASAFVRNLTKEREPTAYLANTFAGQIDGGIRAWPVAGLTARVAGISLGFNF
jgi:iron complex outermembrane recepter protein